MELKDYQRRVVEEVEQYLLTLADVLDKGTTDLSAATAWKRRKLGKYDSRENGVGEDLPTFCIKVPTGGGKTLLATQALGSIYRTILRDRNGAGLVLWVVPSSQIYRDTLKRLRDRQDMYRLMLEHAVSRRIEVWEKDELARLSPSRLRDCLNILIVQLASTNRETKDQLKFFKDSGGAIVDHFPPETDLEAHRKLRERIPNLEVITGTDLVKTSIGNLVRICKPPVILDEGHKATSDLARRTIEGFNASIVVELSATPHEGANIISRVSGDELLREEMIKLPLNVVTSGKKKWQDILTQARDRRVSLAIKAAAYESDGGPERHIRPIVLVQVQRTGKEQRDKGFIHSEDVKEFLRQKLDVPENAIAIKSAEDDDLADVEKLTDPGCPIEWIITKSALQEGWDCPFAYILVSLDNTGSGRAMTQLVGRVLRQPHQKKTGISDLDESYAYCLHEKPTEVLKHVKSALEKEGYEGEAQSMVSSGDGTDKQPIQRVAEWRTEFRDMYRKPFEGKIYLPRFCVKEGRTFEPLDYYRHLVSRVDVDQFEYDKIDWPLAKEIELQKERMYRVTLGENPTRQYETDIDLWESDDRVLAWMAANVNIAFLSHKQLKRVVDRVYERVMAGELPGKVKGLLAAVKTEVRGRLERFIHEQVDKQTEKAFGELFDAGRVLFYLECADCRFEIPSSITIASKGGGAIEPLKHDNGDDLGKSLFDFVEKEGQNQYERQVALVLDRNADVLWWFRNKVGPENFTVQGYRRAKIYPDFVVQGTFKGKPMHRVLVVESKGAHLEGNPDSTYKRNVADYFDRAGKKVTWQQLGAEFKDHLFRFQVLDEAQDYGRTWKDELQAALAK